MTNPPLVSEESPPRQAYPSDISSRQWEQVDLLLPADSDCGRNRRRSVREVVNAVNYRWMTGCSWRMLPHDLPPWQTVYRYFRQWQRAGLLSPLREILISRSLRMSRAPGPSPIPADDNSETPTVLNPASRSSGSERESSSWFSESPISHSRS